MIIKKALLKLTHDEMTKLAVRLYDYDNDSTVLWELYDLIAPSIKDMIASRLILLTKNYDKVNEYLEEIEALEWLYDRCHETYCKQHNTEGNF